MIEKSCTDSNIANILNLNNIENILDVGANTGQFALELRYNGYKKKIISFEPLKSAHKKLRIFSKKDKNWIIYKRGAIGAKKENLEINVSRNSVSSSFLPMLDYHKKIHQKSQYFEKEIVPVFVLDEISTEIDFTNKNFALKVDTQGFEMEVFKGS